MLVSCGNGEALIMLKHSCKYDYDGLGGLPIARQYPQSLIRTNSYPAPFLSLSS